VSFDLTIAEKVIEAFANRNIDIAGAVDAFRSGDVNQILPVVEDLLQVASDAGAPYANDVRLGLVLVGLIVKAYGDGLIASAQPEDPAMRHAEGRQTGTPQMHVPLPPGADPYDPYGFDKRK
jgi:hypothetical protein